jgi:hypothetical protein
MTTRNQGMMKIENGLMKVEDMEGNVGIYYIMCNEELKFIFRARSLLHDSVDVVYT